MKFRILQDPARINVIKGINLRIYCKNNTIIKENSPKKK
jgi:hypothetical protein